MPLAHVAQAVGHFARARVGVGPEPDRRHVQCRHRPQRGFQVQAVVGLRGDGMLHHHQERLLDINGVPDAEPIDLVAGDRRIDRSGQFNIERAGIEDVLGVFAHGQHPPLRIGISHEMQVRQLGNGVTHALVDAAGDVATLDVRDGDVQVGRRHRNRQLLKPIAADHDDVRVGGVELVGELERGQAGRFRHRDVIATLDHVEQRGRNLEAAGLDVVSNVPAVLVEQDRAAEHQLEVDARMRLQLAEQQLAAAVIGAVRNRKTDFALHGHGSPGSRRANAATDWTQIGRRLRTRRAPPSTAGPRGGQRPPPRGSGAGFESGPEIPRPALESGSAASWPDALVSAASAGPRVICVNRCKSVAVRFTRARGDRIWRSARFTIVLGRD